VSLQGGLTGARLLVFDWDGTLMDSTRKIVSCFAAAIRDLDLPPRDASAIRHIIGLGLPQACAALFPELGESEQRALGRQYSRHYLERSAEPAPLFEGVAELLERFEQAGYWLAVATGKGRTGLRQALIQTGLEGRFHTTRCAEETASKPDPLMLREILEETGFAIEEAVMVGDATFDILMAQAIGMPAVAVSCGAADRDRLAALAPHALLDGVLGLEALLPRRPGSAE